MVGYLLRHSHLLVSLAGALIGVAASLASRRVHARRRPLAYRRYRRLFIPIALIAAVTAGATALFVPSGRHILTEWKLAILHGSAWGMIVFAVLTVRSFYRLLFVLPVLVVLGASLPLWTPMPAFDGQPAGVAGIAVVEEPIEAPTGASAGTPAGTTIAILRVRRSLETQETEILVLPTAPLTPIGKTVTPIGSGVVVDVELFTPPFGLWWLPPRGTPLRVQIGDVTLLRYPEEGLRTRLLAFLEETGITKRTRYSVRYPRDPSRFIQPGVFFVEMTLNPLSFRTDPTDDV